MAETRLNKKSQQQQGTELINLRFYENQKRQALLTSSTPEEGDQPEEVASIDAGLKSTSALTTNQGVEFCDTVAEQALNLSPTSGQTGTYLINFTKRN